MQSQNNKGKNGLMQISESLSDFIRTEIYTLSRAKVLSVVLTDSTTNTSLKIKSFQFGKIRRSNPHSLDHRSLIYSTGHLKKSKANKLSLNRIDRTFKFNPNPRLCTDFFLSSFENVHADDQPVLLCRPEFEDVKNSVAFQEECDKTMAKMYSMRMFDHFTDNDGNVHYLSHPKYSEIRNAIFTGLRNFCENCNIPLSSLSDNINNELSPFESFMKAIVFSVLCKSKEIFSDELLAYYIRVNLTKPKLYNSIGDPICCICCLAFCSHILSKSASKQSTYIPPFPSSPCDNECFLTSPGVIRPSYFQNLTFSIHEIKAMLTKLNNPCLVAQLVKLPCFVVFSLEPDLKRKQKYVEPTIEYNIVNLDPTKHDLFKPCTPKTPFHNYNFLCELPCHGPNQTQHPGCQCNDGCSLNNIYTGELKNKGSCVCAMANRECNPLYCKCCFSEHAEFGIISCNNLNFSRRMIPKLQLNNSKIHNIGLFANQDFKMHDFVGPYTGELISDEEVNRREPIYKLSWLNYMFFHSKNYTLDSSWIGCETKYANHSDRSANVIARICFLANGDRLVGLFASTDIKKGTEICFNYGKLYFQSVKESPSIDDTTSDGSEPTKQ